MINKVEIFLMINKILQKKVTMRKGGFKFIQRNQIIFQGFLNNVEKSKTAKLEINQNKLNIH